MAKKKKTQDADDDAVQRIIENLKSDNPNWTLQLLGPKILRLWVLASDERESDAFRREAIGFFDAIHNYGIEDYSRNLESLFDRLTHLSALSAYMIAEDKLCDELEMSSSTRNAVTSETVVRISALMEDSVRRSLDESLFRKMESQWRQIYPPGKYGRVPFSFREHSHPIENYINMTWDQGYPSPEIIYAIAIGFHRYLRAEGALSLDEALLGRKHSKRTSLAYRSRYTAYQSFFYELHGGTGNPKSFIYQEWHEKYGKMNRTQIAELFLVEHSHMVKPKTDVDTFLRGYDRWIKETFNDKTR